MMQETLAIPPGFQRHFRQSPLTDPWEPIYSRRTDSAVVLGLVAESAHTNSRGMVHEAIYNVWSPELLTDARGEADSERAREVFHVTQPGTLPLASGVFTARRTRSS